MEEYMSNNKLPQNYVQLFSLYPKIKEALEECEYDEDILLETDWEGKLNNPQTLDNTIGKIKDEDGHWLDGLINIVDEPDYHEISDWSVNLRQRLSIALAVLYDGDSGLEAMTYSDINISKCHDEVLKSLDCFDIPHEIMNDIDIDSMEWNRNIDRDLGSDWAGKMQRMF